DMYVGKVTSDSSIELMAQSDIWDAFDDADAPIVNIFTGDVLDPATGDITLQAGGHIGDQVNPLDIEIIKGHLTSTSGVHTFLHSFYDLKVDEIEAENGDVNLDVEGFIVDSRNDDEWNIRAVGINLHIMKLDPEAGFIGSLDNQLDIDSSQPENGSVNADAPGVIFLRETTGDMRLVLIASGTEVNLFTQDGAIVDDDADKTNDIDAPVVLLFGAAGIGEPVNALETTVEHVEGAVEDGGIWIDNTGALTVGGIETELGIETTGLFATGDIVIQAMSPMTVSEDVESTLANITLHAADSPTMSLLTHPNGGAAVSALDNDGDSDDDLIVENNSTIKGALSVILLAGDDMLIESGSTISTDADNDTRVEDKIVLRIDHGDADDNIGTDAHGNAFNTGARLDLLGAVSTTTLLITGQRDDDVFYLHPDSLCGHTQILGDISDESGGSDRFILDHLPTLNSIHDRPNHLLRSGQNAPVPDTIDLDGRGGTDHYVVNISGNGASYLVNVHDTGAPDDGADTLSIHTLNAVGTDAFDWDHPQQSGVDAETEDVFLLRKNFVAYLTEDGVDEENRPIFQNAVERINYDNTINGRLLVSSGKGDDQFYVDDNSAITTLDGGEGKDLFQIGQVFGSNPNGYTYADGAVDVRSVASDFQNIDLTSDKDDLKLLQITRGWLSQGITHALTAFGGEGGDVFNVYSNKAVLRMEGESGNDTFVIRAFIAEDDIIAEGGGDDDHFEYNINAPVSINGGLGFDTVVAIGTEREDAFLITEEGIFGAGLNITVDGVEEAIEVDGLEGDDHFFILSTRDDVVTTVIGGLGSDSFIVTGDVTQKVISQNLDGLSSVINHGASSEAGNPYDKLVVDGISVTIATPTQGKVVIDQDSETTSPGFTRVTEDSGDQDGYWISLVRPAGLDNSAKAYLTLSAAVSSSYDRRLDVRAQGGDEAESILISIDGGGTWQSSAVLTFDASDWDVPKRVLVKAAHDDAIEGERKVMISHSLLVESDSQDDIDAFNEIAISNVEVQVMDDDLGTLLIEELNADGVVDNQTRVLEGSETSAIDDVYRVRLSVAPEADVTVSLDFNDEQLAVFKDGARITELTFTADAEQNGDDGNWDEWVTLTVKAVNANEDGSVETTRENGQISRIVHNFTTGDGIYHGAAEVELDVRVLDDDAAAVLVTESDGATRLVKGVSGDDYSLRLVSNPGAPVTVNLYGDGQTRLTDSTIADSRVILSAIGEAAAVYVTVDGGSLIRRDGVSWVDDGFSVGALFTIGGRETLYKVNNIADEMDEDTGAVISSTLILTLDADLSGVQTESIAMQRMAYGVTFDSTNWWEEFTIHIEADTNFEPDVNQQYVRNEPIRQHLVSQIAGPLIIEGGVAEGKDRSLRPAVMLPTESTDTPINISVNTDETKQADRLNIFNDSSAADDSGWLSGVELRNDFIKLGNENQTDEVRPINLSGLGMRPDGDGKSLSLNVDISEEQDGSNVITIPGGVTFDDIEITEILLGQGNDAMNIDATSTGTSGAGDYVVTVIHGGGNALLEDGDVGGDRFTVTGGGGENSPLVIFGDTAQDGGRYDSRPDLGIFTGNAAYFNRHGHDVIDASQSSHGVTIYGGAGNDVIYGSQAGDHIAGGSGDDEIHGQGGLDHIYGDTGFNLDYDVVIDENDNHTVARELIITNFDTSQILTRDVLLEPGKDAIYGDDGDDVILGDYGIVHQTEGTLRILSTENITYVETVRPTDGEDDFIEGNAGNDVILAGNGDDKIYGNEGDDYILGDIGRITYSNGGPDELFAPVEPHDGGADSIFGNEGNDFIIGGSESDEIEGNEGSNITIGDSGVIADIVQGDTILVESLSTEPSSGSDIIGTGSGIDVIFGSSGEDIITISGGDNVVMGDNGGMRFRIDNGELEIIEIHTWAPSYGANDTITTGSGKDIILGGVGADTINAGDGENIVIGDFGIVEGFISDDSRKIELVEAHRARDEKRFDGVTLGGDDLQGGEAEIVETGDADIITTGLANDIILGGIGGDKIHAGNGNDLIFGDHGRITGDVNNSSLPLALSAGSPFEFQAIHTQIDDGGGDDQIWGEDGDDIILGQQGADLIYGGAGDDDIIGGHNAAGGHDSSDAIDGGTGDDAIAGDNAEIDRRDDNLSPRIRILQGQQIYGDNGSALITTDQQNNPDVDQERDIKILDHSDSPDELTYGHDYIAGGADD
ncbi:MAG: calcium-binding protein, partial [Candidatus Hinthialibacter sp.]